MKRGILFFVIIFISVIYTQEVYSGNRDICEYNYGADPIEGVYSTEIINDCEDILDVSPWDRYKSYKKYILNDDIETNTLSSCINIQRSCVILDCQGHKIEFTTTGDSGTSIQIGIFNNEFKNIIVRNCVIEGFDIGIKVEGGITYSKIFNNALFVNFDTDTFNNPAITFNSGNSALNINYNNITNNVIYADKAFSYPSAGGIGYNRIYNNYFNTTSDVIWGSSYLDNYFYKNPPNLLETNVLGTLGVGGNYYAKPDGTGFSQDNTLCNPSEGSVFCSNSYSLITGVIDEYPLTNLEIIPEVVTLSAGPIGPHAALLKGELVNFGSQMDMYYGFDYKKSTDSSWESTSFYSISTTGEFEEDALNLEENTDYDFKAIIRWDSGSKRVEGNTLQFKTLDPATIPGTYCGDNIIQTPNDEGVNEECDGSEMGSLDSCEAHGFDDGVLTCNAGCQYNTNQCYNDSTEPESPPPVGPNDHITYGECVDDGNGDEYGVVNWAVYDENGHQTESGNTACFIDMRSVSFFGNYSIVLFMLILVFFYFFHKKK